MMRQIVAALVVASLAPEARTSAQESRYLDSCMTALESVIDLNANQREVIAAFADEFRRESSRLQASFSKQLTELAAANAATHASDPSLSWQEVAERSGWSAALKEQRELVDQLRADFAAALRSVLSDDQLRSWHNIEERTLRSGVFEIVGAMLARPVPILEDVVEVSDTANEPPVVELLAEYRSSIRPVLDEMILLERAGGSVSLSRRWQSANAVRRVTWQYAGSIQAALPLPAARRFQVAFRTAAYPWLFKDTLVDAVYREISRHSDDALTHELFSEYTRRISEIRDMVVATIEAEPGRRVDEPPPSPSEAQVRATHLLISTVLDFSQRLSRRGGEIGVKDTFIRRLAESLAEADD